MNENTEYARTSRVARASHTLGVLALLLLVLSGACILALALAGREGKPGSQVLSQGDVTGLSLGAVFCQGLAVVAALDAFILGILGLADIREGAGKVKGRGLAVSGLVTASLTMLTLVLGYCVVLLPIVWPDRKLESSTKLKELGLAMMLYEEDHGSLPPAVLRDPGLGDRGQPYSWRVALLPYLGESELYSQYRRDEPWDSPANKAVLARMPRVFAPPVGRAADGLTHYQVLVGPGTAFERPDLRLNTFRADCFPRGAAQTILVVEAAAPVPWTKPVDLSYTPDGPLPKVGGLVRNGFHALFADGSVLWIEAEQQEIKLRTHVPRDGR
jgi:hypothetical protein